MLSAFGPPHCSTRSFCRWNIGARGSWWPSDHSSQHTACSARWRSPSRSSASVAGNGGAVIARPSSSSRADEFLPARQVVGHRTPPSARIGLLGHREVALVAGEPLALDRRDRDRGRRTSTRACRAGPSADRRGTRASRRRSSGVSGRPERAVQLVDHPDLVLHEVGVVHVVHACGIEGPVGRRGDQVVERGGPHVARGSGRCRRSRPGRCAPTAASPPGW